MDPFDKFYLSCLECGEVFEAIHGGAEAARVHETKNEDCAATTYEILTEEEAI